MPLPPRRATRRDANEPQVVATLRKAGGVWVALGWPVDGVAGLSGRWAMVEIKNPENPPSKRALTEDEAAFVADCRRRALPVLVVETGEDLLRGMGVMT